MYGKTTRPISKRQSKLSNSPDMIYSAGRGAMDNAATAAYGVRGIPTIMLIDPEGTIVIRTYNGAEVVEKVHEVLGEKK